MCAVFVGQNAFALGEVAPGLWARTDTARVHVGASTARNGVVKYTGGWMSRGGTAFVGFSKQTGRSFPPRMLPFQFSINQGLALEFGNQYMRVISGGAFVTENPYTVTNITNANPAVVTISGGRGAASAVVINTGVLATYAPAELVTLAGGTYSQQTVLRVTNTKLLSLVKNAGGAGYAALDTITVTGGTQSTPVVLTVGTVDGGGAILTFAITNAGVFTANPSGGTFTQAASSGAGLGATFQQAILGPNAVTVPTPGIYTSYPLNPVAQASTTGSGLGATFTVTTTAVTPLQNDDWMQLAGMQGMTQVNGQTYRIANVTATTFTLKDVYGNAINSTAFGVFIAGGTASRIFTLTTPWAEQDVKWLKFTQSADTLSFGCVNQDTLTEYPAMDLKRLGNTNWLLSTVSPAPSIGAPTGVTATPTTAGGVIYQYVVTAVSPEDGSESVASSVAQVSSVNISTVAGSITVKWAAVAGVTQYNVYRTTPTYAGTAPVGALFGFIGNAFGVQFTDTNLVPDFIQVPPLKANPFAQGPLLSVTPQTGGTGYTTVTATINTTTGSGAIVQGIIVGGAIAGFLVLTGGSGYQPTDTVTITGDGSGATASLVIGPQAGTYPGAVCYFQERRGYGYTLNTPDTYFFSQPGAFTNFDSRVPSADSDAIIGSPWATQINGIQFMVPRPGGLVVFTGKEAWQLTGTGGSSFNPQPIAPATQQAQPQAFNGCSAYIPPIGTAEDIIYVENNNFTYRDFVYNFYSNIYTGEDLTVNSPHLFIGYQIQEHAWCEEPYRLLWSVRDDGTMVCLTFVKSEKVSGWTRHDTNGLFKSVCSIIELPVNALYCAVERFPGANTAYMIERMDNRVWRTIDDEWCVDAGLALPRPAPDAVLTIASANGSGAIGGATIADGGTGWSALTEATVVDDNGTGPGTGATATLTIVAGVITGVIFPTPGADYTRPALVLYDPAGSEGGSGADIALILDTATTISASGSVFPVACVGSVIRAAGGMATVTARTNDMLVTVRVTQPFQTIPNSTDVPDVPSGEWTLTAPVSTVTGLNHLIGAVVSGVADGEVIPEQTVSDQGTIALATLATAIVVGLKFAAQLQSLYLDPPGPTEQGARKKNAAVTVRMENSRGFTIGANQADGSTLSPPQTAPVWNSLTDAPSQGVPSYNSSQTPLFTGDIRVALPGGWNSKGQIAIQQLLPLPVTVLGLFVEESRGDLAQKGTGGRGRGSVEA